LRLLKAGQNIFTTGFECRTKKNTFLKTPTLLFNPLSASDVNSRHDGDVGWNGFSASYRQN